HISPGSIYVFQYLRTECKRTGELASCRGGAGRAVLVLKESLHLTGNEVHRTSGSFAPSVVDRVECRKPEPSVVAIVRELVEHAVRSWMHHLEPPEAPRCFVEDGGLSMASLEAVVLVFVTEDAREMAVGSQKVIGCVCRRGSGLKVVGSVVPATG